ncbi:MAG: dihydrodipicolinate reductase [Deltaproteobacteria bacterium]
MANEMAGIPVVVTGLGEVGGAVARAVLSSAELRLVGAVDPSLAGQTLDSVVGTPTGIVIEADPARALKAARGGVLLLCGTSRFLEALPALEQAVRAGLSVVSTCEELAYPWLAHEEEADRLDALCERNDVAVVAAGVSPGLALDRLPALLSQGTGEVRRIEARRVVDVSARGELAWRGCGAGLDPAEFQRAAEAEAIGQRGLAESATLAALGCGFDLDELEEEAEPVLSSRELTGVLRIPRGGISGIRQVARGWQDGREVIRLEVVTAVGATDPRDEVAIEADPPLRLVVPGGFPAVASAAWSAVHAALAVTQLQGLVTVLDLPPGRS